MTTWDQLEHDLGKQLPALPELETILWEAGGRCVQLQQTRLSLGLAVVSNEYLPAEYALTTGEEQQLAQWGWEPPNSGDRNWHIEALWPMTSADGIRLANLLRRTMRLILAVEQPEDVTVRRFTAREADPRRRRAGS